MDSVEAFTAIIDQSYEADASARQLAAEAARQQNDSERLANSAIAMRRAAVDQFASNLQNEDPLYRAAIQIAWQDFATPGSEEKIQTHQITQLKLADKAAKDLLQLDTYTKAQTIGLPFASIVYRQLEYVSNQSSLSNPHESDLKRTKVIGLSALVGVLAPQPLAVGYVFERMNGSMNGIMKPVGIGLQHATAMHIHSETGGWDHDVWEEDPRVLNQQSGSIAIVMPKQVPPTITIVSLEQGNENIYMALPKGGELHIGKAALSDFAVGLEVYEKPHDTEAFGLVHQKVLKLYNAV